MNVQPNKISPEVLKELDQLSVRGCEVRITRQLDRPLYQGVNRVLEELGGRWNRNLKTHLFNAPVEERLSEVIESGSIVTAASLGFFETPRELAERMVMLAELSPGHAVLEPSAGLGAIAKEIARREPRILVCVEYDAARATSLKNQGFNVEQRDFLDGSPRKFKFDRAVMNPPFAKQQDIDHVKAAFEQLVSGGILVSVMSSGVTFRENGKAKAFRELVAKCGTVEELPAGTFKVSGTNVNTVLVKLTAP